MPGALFIVLTKFLMRGYRIMRGRPELASLLWASLGIIGLGAAFFKWAEPEQFATWTDAIYFTVITLTTVGYGDFSPTRDLTKWVVMAYIFIGLGIMGAFVAIVGEAFLEDAERKANTLKDKKSKKDVESED